MNDRPGVMLYFDLRDQLQFCTDEELGKLLRAILDYGATGVLPEFSDRAMQILWHGIQPRIDHDAVRYEKRKMARSLGGHNKNASDKGEDRISMDEYEERLRKQNEETSRKETSDKKAWKKPRQAERKALAPVNVTEGETDRLL